MSALIQKESYLRKVISISCSVQVCLPVSSLTSSLHVYKYAWICVCVLPTQALAAEQEKVKELLVQKDLWFRKVRGGVASGRHIVLVRQCCAGMRSFWAYTHISFET